ncbi:MAG: TetR/AcrR family transcriptional regulator, partial [Desulfobacterales bacterium]|nr:TetR/AcrR family transcriptional regulator [Desulfobacterales bacterium]
MNGTPPRNLERRTRADQLEANRRALMKAAVHLVGKDGYAKTSVVRITTRAGLGQGTFYTYFDSRQELFDLLLPEVGNEILEFVRARVVGSKIIIDVEERSFKAFVDYLLHNPAYIRILIEAGTMAPKAGREHTQSVVEQHVATLMHAWDKGQLPSYSRKEIPSLSAVLLALRMHFV